MKSGEAIEETRKIGGIALFVGTVYSILAPCALYFKLLPLIYVLVPLFYWALPFLISWRTERKGPGSLGLTFRKERCITYILYALFGFILLIIRLGVTFYFKIHFAGDPSRVVLSHPENLIKGLIIQIMAVGLPEEIFFRGYLMSRFCNWLGDCKGLVLSSFIFGIGHTTSRIAQFGLNYALSSTLIGVSAFIGGLIYGYQYLRTKSIIPSTIAHISLNMFGTQIIASVLALL